MKPPYFRDRNEAGRLLAEKLRMYASYPNVIVLALPRGGVPVGYEVAHALGAPLDIFLVRKLGVPGYNFLIHCLLSLQKHSLEPKSRDSYMPFIGPLKQV